MQDLATLRAQNAERATDTDRLRLDLATIRADRDAARTEIATLKAQGEAFEARLLELREAKDVMAAQFGDVANKLLSDAQKTFLERADARFRQSEETAGQNLKSMLQPVSDRLQRYEEGVAKVEAERRDAFGDLKGQIEQMRLGQEKVSHRGRQARQFAPQRPQIARPLGRAAAEERARNLRPVANTPISRPRSRSRSATTAAGCAPTRSSACPAAARW